MLFGWFDARHATEVGITLADQFAAQSEGHTRRRKTASRPDNADPVRKLLQRAEQEARALPLNFYKKARLANAFKWRLVEKGLEAAVAADVTQTLVMHLSVNRPASEPFIPQLSEASEQNARALLGRAEQLITQGAHAEAVAAYQAILVQHPRNTDALNNLAAGLCQLGRHREAEPYLRKAIDIKPKFAQAYFNLGTVLRTRGHLPAAAQAFRRSLKLAPNDVEARVGLGGTLHAMGRVQESQAQYQRAFKLTPRHLGARVGMAEIAEMEGRFDEAEALYRQIIEDTPDAVEALCGLLLVRKTTAAEAPLAQRLERILSGGIEHGRGPPLHFALGKYYDDVRDFGSAFSHYTRANQLLKANADRYSHEANRQVVDELIRTYPRSALAPTSGSSPSTKPVFVVGMPRSGTSLVEQILASHPAAAGAGELDFWFDTMHQRERALQKKLPDEDQKRELAAAYLQVLSKHGADASRVIDKAPVNSDYLGLIHSVFPQARVIYVRRNPIDTCLSCYFQAFSAALAYTMDLSDLAHYYRQHSRLNAHWRAVLPPGTMLEVPYEELIADQEHWTRTMLDFLGLDWDPRCLDFQATRRTVATASAWQVRQKLYRSSVERWRNYEEFIGPLLELEDLTLKMPVDA
jgi:tetratricopeptide (TPR) repeat protein